ncbi:MAG TPA: Ger(x)C family spore germination protein [Bacillales bacterium]|nr:Ger(x)C family spore germination protein [Bacillales bacterium]
MKWKTCLISLLTGSILLSGCWDAHELGDLAFVAGMGVDLTKKGLYDVSFQIVNPGQVSGGQSSSQSGQGTAVTTYSETGKSLFEAVRKASREVPRRLAFAHTSVFIIGERLARSGKLPKILDFIERYYKFRSTTLVLVAKHGKAKPILTILNPLEKVPAVKIMETIGKGAELLGGNIKLNINDVVQALTNPTRSLSLIGIELYGNPAKGQTMIKNQQVIPTAVVKINGLAIFKQGKLEGWLEGQKAHGASWVQNKINKTVVQLPCKKNGGVMAVEVLRSKTNLKPSVHGNKEKMKISIRAEGNLQEVSCRLDIKNPVVIRKLQDQFSAKIEKDAMAAVKAAQKHRADIFGFGDVVEREYPDRWKKLEKNWPETFSKMKVNFNVKFFIRRSGLRTNPLIYKKS